VTSPFAISDSRMPIAGILLLGSTIVARSQPAHSAADEIPPLAPPLPEIPPSFWEQFGWTLWIVIPLGLVLAGLAVWLVWRPGKPPVLTAPAARAREILRTLLPHPAGLSHQCLLVATAGNDHQRLLPAVDAA